MAFQVSSMEVSGHNVQDMTLALLLILPCFPLRSINKASSEEELQMLKLYLLSELNPANAIKYKILRTPRLPKAFPELKDMLLLVQRVWGGCGGGWAAQKARPISIHH